MASKNRKSKMVIKKNNNVNVPVQMQAPIRTSKLVKLWFSSEKCEHDSGIGTDLNDLYVKFNGKDLFAQNNKKFYDVQKFNLTADAARQLAATLIRSFLNVSFEDYYKKLNQEALSQQKHCDLFGAAAVQTIYAHTSAYFGVKDLFVEHRKFVEKFVGKFGGTFMPVNPKGINKYDAILSDAVRVDRTYVGQEERNELVNYICKLYQKQYFEFIQMDVQVIRSLYIYLNLGQIDNDFNFKYFNENLKKAGCGCRNHNSIVNSFNQYAPLNQQIKVDFKQYSPIKKIRVIYYERKPQIQNPIYYQYGTEHDARTKIGSNQNVLERVITNVSVERHLALIQIMNNVAAKKQFQDTGILRQTKTLQAICQERMLLMGGHNLNRLQTEKKDYRLITTPIIIDPFIIEFYGNLMWCKSNDKNPLFSEGSNFIIMSRTLPTFTGKGMASLSRYFQGFYAIMARGKDVLIFNPNVKMSIMFYTKRLCINLPDDYIIWMESITRDHADYVPIHKFLQFGGYQDYTTGIDQMKRAFMLLGFRPWYYHQMLEDWEYFLQAMSQYGPF